jgi:hypothetical protein
MDFEEREIRIFYSDELDASFLEIGLHGNWTVATYSINVN